MWHFVFELLYSCLPFAILIYIAMFVVSIVLLCKRDKRALIGITICIFIIIAVEKSDFWKSRKQVNVQWMYGKTVEQVQQRYSVPPNDWSAYITPKEGYILVAREIYRWSKYDGMEGQYMYYVLLDENGYIEDVDICDFGGYPAPHNYMDRW